MGRIRSLGMILKKVLNILITAFVAGLLTACGISSDNAVAPATAAQVSPEKQTVPTSAPLLTPTSVPTLTPTSASTLTPTPAVKEYRIEYDLNDELKECLIDTPYSAKAGDCVEIKTAVLYDADICVYVDGQAVEKSHYDSDYWGYSFEIPDKDVTITMEIVDGRKDKETGLIVKDVYLEGSMTYADHSVIFTDPAKLYINKNAAHEDIVICVNAGHGTKGGNKVKTLSHPDGTPKVTGGTNPLGAIESAAVSSGMTFLDRVPEYKVNLSQAMILKELLLEEGYSVLMIRETDDVRLDNVARAVLANTYADCHIALHWNSTTTDAGAFYCSVPDKGDYRQMEPVASNWEKHNALGECLIEGLRSQNIKIHKDSSHDIDLTQTSYSTIPSAVVELGDKISDHSEERLYENAAGLVNGINAFFSVSDDK